MKSRWTEIPKTGPGRKPSSSITISKSGSTARAAFGSSLVEHLRGTLYVSVRVSSGDRRIGFVFLKAPVEGAYRLVPNGSSFCINSVPLSTVDFVRQLFDLPLAQRQFLPVEEEGMWTIQIPSPEGSSKPPVEGAARGKKLAQKAKTP